LNIISMIALSYSIRIAKLFIFHLRELKVLCHSNRYIKIKNLWKNLLKCYKNLTYTQHKIVVYHLKAMILLIINRMLIKIKKI
jgi:hypothetical protein